MKLYLIGGAVVALLLGLLLWVSAQLGEARAEQRQLSQSLAQIALDAKAASALGSKLDTLRNVRVERTNEIFHTLEQVPVSTNCVLSPAYDSYAGLRLAEPATLGPAE